MKEIKITTYPFLTKHYRRVAIGVKNSFVNTGLQLSDDKVLILSREQFELSTESFMDCISKEDALKIYEGVDFLLIPNQLNYLNWIKKFNKYNKDIIKLIL